MKRDIGPTLRAAPFRAIGGGARVRLLSTKQRQHLTDIATRIEVGPRTIIYREDAPATSILICREGVVKAFRELPSGTTRVHAFLFADDLFGLAENGRYVNSAQAIARSVLFRIPVASLAEAFKADPEIEFAFLCKVTHELRQSQRRAIILARRDAAGRLAMFLHMLEREMPHAMSGAAIRLPMSRSDIAAYLGLSPEAVTRAASNLVGKGLLAFDGRHSVRILDRARLDALVAAV